MADSVLAQRFLLSCVERSAVERCVQLKADDQAPRHDHRQASPPDVSPQKPSCGTPQDSFCCCPGWPLASRDCFTPDKSQIVLKIRWLQEPAQAPGEQLAAYSLYLQCSPQRAIVDLTHRPARASAML